MTSHDDSPAEGPDDGPSGDTPRADIREMIVVHRALRREFGALPAAVRGVSSGDRAQIQIVARHLRLLLDGLHLHHEGEDVELWPLLERRVPARAELTARMQHQHEELARLVAETGEQATAWEQTAGNPEPLARTLDSLYAALVVHLGDEEEQMLPVVAEHVSATEWSRLGDHARRHMRPKELPLFFGAVLEECDTAERAMILATLPAPVRLLTRPLIEPIYRRYIRRVRSASAA